MIIWGLRGRVRQLATVRGTCARCGQVAAQRLIRAQRWFTLFFIPIFPYRTRYIATCTYCGASTEIAAEFAKRMAGAGAGDAPPPQSGPPPPPPSTT